MKYEKVPQKKSMVAVLYSTAMILWQMLVSLVASDSFPKSTLSSFTSALSVDSSMQVTSIAVWSLIIIHSGNQSAINQKTSISDIFHTFNNKSGQQLWIQSSCGLWWFLCWGQWRKAQVSVFIMSCIIIFIMVLMMKMMISGFWPNVLPKIIARSTGVSTAALVKVCFKTQINSTVCFFAYTRHKFVEIRNQLYKLMTCDGLFVCTESL